MGYKKTVFFLLDRAEGFRFKFCSLSFYNCAFKSTGYSWETCFVISWRKTTNQEYVLEHHLELNTATQMLIHMYMIYKYTKICKSEN